VCRDGGRSWKGFEQDKLPGRSPDPAAFPAGCHFYRLYCAAGDFTLGVASVLLLVVGAVVPDVVLLFVLLGRPEFGALAPMPLSEFVMPGVP
jgi:hypothetical protein